MAGSTDHYGLSKLTRGDNFDANGYKHTNQDRDTIDTGIYLGSEGHRHVGGAGSLTEPSMAPTLEVSPTGGTLPASTRIYYKYTYVNNRGEETIASPETFVDTPTAIGTPSAPVLSYATTGGTLLGGNYYYMLTSYVGVTSSESRALNSQFLTVPSATTTNVITITFPEEEPGQTGFNLYRRSPGQAKYFHLATIPTNIATPPTTYEDNGSVSPDPDRGVPLTNTTNSTNSVTITMPGATPSVPSGYTWKLYRTYVTGNWANSLITHVVENVTEGDPNTIPTYTDVGVAAQSGTFPLTSLVFGNPTKINLTDATEAQGTLPMGLVSAFPYVVTLDFPGTVTYGEGEVQWPCPFESAVVISAIASLGRDEQTMAGPVIADVLIGTNAATPVFTSVYTAENFMPYIPLGSDRSNVYPANKPLASRDLVAGDVISVNIVEFPGTATPTNVNMTVSVLLYVKVSDLTSFVFP